jgi:hypothetical protein
MRHRARDIGSRSELALSHLGVGRGRFFRRESTRALPLLILHLRHQWDRLLAIPELHEETATGERDRQIALTEPPYQVEGLPRRPRAGELKGIRRHAPLHRRPYLRRGAEEAVRRHQTPDPLMGTAEVVGLDEKTHPSLAVLEVREDRPREQLLPQGLPEALDLPQRLRVVRAALDVADALTAKLLLEVGVPAPSRVLPALVGEDLPRRPVIRDPPRERLQDERASLVMGDHERHQVPRVVVHEGGHVHPLVTPQQEGEDVALPELVRLRPLEAPLRLHLR